MSLGIAVQERESIVVHWADFNDVSDEWVEAEFRSDRRAWYRAQCETDFENFTMMSVKVSRRTCDVTCLACIAVME